MEANRRGITPIISVILLLMMTVGISGAAWYWMQGLTASIMDTTKNMTEKQLAQMLTLITLVDYDVECDANGNATTLIIQVFNQGGTTVNLNNAVINGKKAAVTPVTLNPGDLDSLRIGNIQSYLPGLGRSTAKPAELTISSPQGYIKESETIDGSRCDT